MENRSYAFLAIGFLVVFIAGIGVLIAWLNRGEPESRYYDIVSQYSVAGLQPQADVRIKGLLVGHVKDIRFDARDPSRVLVRIAVFPNAYVTAATHAELSYEGLTGLAHVTLVTAAGGVRERLPTSAAHPAQIPMQRGWLQVLADAAKPDAEEIGEVLASLHQVLGAENRQHIADLLAQLDQVSRRLVALEDALAPTLHALPEVAARSDRTLRKGEQLLDQARALGNAVPRSLQQVDAAAASVADLGSASQQLVHELSRTLAELNAAIARIDRTTRDIDRLSRELQREPESVLFGPSPPPPGPGEPGFHAPSPVAPR